MLRYSKGAEPSCLRTMQTTPGGGYASLGRIDRDAIRPALVRDQAALCAYCERRINADDGEMKIEHWQAQSTGQQQLGWPNMLGVCSGITLVGGKRISQCDDHRRNRRLFLHPIEGRGPNPRDFLRYTADGQLRTEDARAGQDIAFLNLDNDLLRRNRAAVYDQLHASLARKGFPRAEIERKLRACEIQPGTLAPAYAEFTRYHLLRWLRRM